MNFGWKYCPRRIRNRNLQLKDVWKQTAINPIYIPWNTFFWSVSYSSTWLQSLFQSLHNRDAEQSDYTTQYEALHALVPLQQFVWSWTFSEKTKYHQRVSKTVCQYQRTTTNPHLSGLTVREKKWKRSLKPNLTNSASLNKTNYGNLYF